jgi:hypothetical protein
VTKHRRLHSASTWPSFRCVLVPSRQNPPGPRARLSANWLDAVSRKTGLTQDTHATELRHRCTPPSLPLHSAGQASSLRGIDQRDQSDFGFSALLAPNPKPLSSRKAGAPTAHLAWNNIRSHHRWLNLERLAWHPMRMLLTRTPHPLTFHRDFGHAPGQHEISC